MCLVTLNFSTTKKKTFIDFYRKKKKTKETQNSKKLYIFFLNTNSNWIMFEILYRRRRKKKHTKNKPFSFPFLQFKVDSKFNLQLFKWYLFMCLRIGNSFKITSNFRKEYQQEKRIFFSFICFLLMNNE